MLYSHCLYLEITSVQDSVLYHYTALYSTALLLALTLSHPTTALFRLHALRIFFLHEIVFGLPIYSDKAKLYDLFVICHKFVSFSAYF